MKALVANDTAQGNTSQVAVAVAASCGPLRAVGLLKRVGR
jgi:hypothetical protein